MRKKLREAYDDVDTIYDGLVDVFYDEINDFITNQLPVQKIDAILTRRGYNIPDDIVDEVDNSIDDYAVNKHVTALAEIVLSYFLISSWICSCVTSGSCCVDNTTASSLAGFPSSSYSTVT